MTTQNRLELIFSPWCTVLVDRAQNSVSSASRDVHARLVRRGYELVQSGNKADGRRVEYYEKRR